MVVEEERQEGAYEKHHVADHPPRNSNLEPAEDRIGAELVPEAAEPAFSVHLPSNAAQCLPLF